MHPHAAFKKSDNTTAINHVTLQAKLSTDYFMLFHFNRVNQESQERRVLLVVLV